MEGIREETTFTTTIGDREFRLRRWSVVLAYRIIGAGSLNALRGQQEAEDGRSPEMTGADVLEKLEKYLRHGVVATRKTGEDAWQTVDGLSVDDFGPYAFAIMEAINATGGDVAGFRQSSEAVT